MIHDNDLHTCFDYSEGQKQAAHRVLVELANLSKMGKNTPASKGGGINHPN